MGEPDARDPGRPRNRDRTRESWRQVRELLMEWDLIGVAGLPEATDEYDCMISPLLHRLFEGADTRSLADWINGGTAPGRSLLTTDALEASVSALDCRDRQACMGKIVVCAERVVDAPADAVYGYVADMRDHHPRFLPPAFSDFRVESGGTGAGTITRFTVTAGGRTREYRMKVDEPEPGRVLTESDTGSSMITTTTVASRDGDSVVQICTTWDGAGGIGGVFERMFAPRVMRAIYEDELERLNAYAREQRPG